MKKDPEKIIGNHYMYLFEEDDHIIELITNSEIKNKIYSELNVPFLSVSKETVVNVSVSPRLDSNKIRKPSYILKNNNSKILSNH